VAPAPSPVVRSDHPGGAPMSLRLGRIGRLSVVLLVLAVLVCSCGGAGASPDASAPDASAPDASAPDASAPSPAPTPGPTQTASAAPTQGPTIGPAGSPSEVVACPGTVEVVRSLGTPVTDRSTDWAGYAVSSTSTPFTCVEATWTQPSVVCRGTGLAAVAFWVGIGGIGQAGLVQAGTQTQCQYAVATDLAVAVGDRVHTRVLAVGHSAYSLTVENLTTGTSVAVTSPNTTLDPTTAEWIVEAPTVGCPKGCAIASLPDFGTMTFSDVSTTIGGVNGPLDAAGFVHTRTTLVTTSGLARASVSATSRNGRSFAVTWERR
jgi:hypothetical protein